MISNHSQQAAAARAAQDGDGLMESPRYVTETENSRLESANLRRSLTPVGSGEWEWSIHQRVGKLMKTVSCRVKYPGVYVNRTQWLNR